MEESDARSLSFIYGKFIGYVHPKEKQAFYGKIYKERDELLLRKSQKKELKNLLRTEFLKTQRMDM